MGESLQDTSFDVDKAVSSSDSGVQGQSVSDSPGGELSPSQYYVDLFYSQLAYSYYGSLYLYWKENSRRTFGGGSLLQSDFDPLFYLKPKRVTHLFTINSDSGRDFGPRMQLTGSVFFRGTSEQVLLSQAYDSSVSDPQTCDITTEFSLIGEYDSQIKAFSYPGEKKYSINPWERYHISILMKAIFVFMFFDVGKEFYILLISLYMLYVRGFFDGVQELFEKISSNHPMESTLADLRRRRAEIELEALTRTERNEEGKSEEIKKEGGKEREMEGEVKEQENRVKKETEKVEVEKDDQDSGNEKSQVTFYEPEMETGIDSSPAKEEAHFLDSSDFLGTEETRSFIQAGDCGENSRASAQEGPSNTEDSENKTASYFTCLIYQTIGMYILTLMPWWNPDPTYLI
ncbi:multi-pass transmembrane protein [Cryptosporidium felis]|nr:multi-pass transmembrane protein [Cryptosporidium felis]